MHQMVPSRESLSLLLLVKFGVNGDHLPCNRAVSALRSRRLLPADSRARPSPRPLTRRLALPPTAPDRPVRSRHRLTTLGAHQTACRDKAEGHCRDAPRVALPAARRRTGGATWYISALPPSPPRASALHSTNSVIGALVSRARVAASEDQRPRLYRRRGGAVPRRRDCKKIGSGTEKVVRPGGVCRSGVEVQDIRDDTLLDGVSFSVRPGEIVGPAACHDCR